ncbi:MAG: MATE family efflux transporter [Pseudomonadota bacterium]
MLHRSLAGTRIELWRLAWPLLIANTTVPLVGLVDTAVVGHLPEAHHMGAVGLGAATFSALYLVFASVRMGTTGLTAQAVGAGDGAEIRASLLRPLAVAIVVGAVLVALVVPITAAAVVVFGPGQAIADGLRAYVGWRILGAPAALATFVILGWLLGNQDTRSQLVLLVVINVSNAALSAGLGLGLGLGVVGVAMGSALADVVGVGLGLVLVRRRWRGLPGVFDVPTLLAPRAFGRLFEVNGNLVLRTLLMEVTFVAFAAIGARQGEITLAANAALQNLVLLQAYVLDGFAFATEAMVGRAVGRRSQAALRAAFRAAAQASAVLAVLIALGFAATTPALVALLTNIDAVRVTADAHAIYVALVPLIGVWAYLLDGVFSGATRTADLRDASLVATLAFLACAAALVPFAGNHGLWWAFLVFLGCRVLVLGRRFATIDAAVAHHAGRAG